MEKSPCNLTETIRGLQQIAMSYEIGVTTLYDRDVEDIKAAVEYLQDYMDMIEENVRMEV